MATPYFGNYVALTTSTTAQNKTDIKLMLTALLNLIPHEGSNATPASPDFNQLAPAVAEQLRNELTQMAAVITASP